MSDELKAATKALVAAQMEMSAPKKDTANLFFKRPLTFKTGLLLNAIITT